MRKLLLAGVCLTLAACASTPEKPAASAAPERQVAVQAGSVAAAGQPSALVVEGDEAYQPPPGFTRKVRDGGNVYCRARASLGTRIKSEECFSEAELIEVERAMKTGRQDIEQRGRMCTTGQMCTGG